MYVYIYICYLFIYRNSLQSMKSFSGRRLESLPHHVDFIIDRNLIFFATNVILHLRLQLVQLTLHISTHTTIIHLLTIKHLLPRPRSQKRRIIQIPSSPLLQKRNLLIILLLLLLLLLLVLRVRRSL